MRKTVTLSPVVYAAFEAYALTQNEAGVAALVSAFAEAMSSQLKAYEGSEGILTQRSDQLSAELRNIARQREEIDRRMVGVEERLRAKFSALDSLVSRFNNTSTYLAQQLAAISSLNKSS